MLQASDSMGTWMEKRVIQNWWSLSSGGKYLIKETPNQEKYTFSILLVLFRIMLTAQSNTEILTAGQGQLVLDELCTDPCYHFACTAEDLKSAG